MGEVRTYKADFADEVATLYFHAGRGKKQVQSPRLAKYFNDLHLSNPWVSPEMPSYVYLENGKVVGMIGVVPRDMEFRGKKISLATMSMYIVDPELAGGTVAVQLLGRILKGPQDLTWTDGASGSVSMFWSALGGSTGPLYAFNWIRVLRPLGMARGGLDRIGGAARLLKPASGLVTAPIDFFLSKLPLPIGPLRKPESPFHAKLVTAEELLECVQQIGWKEALRPSYSMPSFAWLMTEAAKAKIGTLRLLTVTNPEGVRCGWVVYYAAQGRESFVQQIGVRKRDDFANVLTALLRDAWEQGSVCVKGASIPQYLTALTEQFCFFRHPYNRVVIHSKHPEILNSIRLGEAAITRLDGTSWMRFSRESWD